MWSASRLSRNCAHHNLLADLNPRPTRDAAAARGTAFHSALQDWHSLGAVPLMSDNDVNEWLHTMIAHGWKWPDGAQLEVAWGLSTWGTCVAVEEPEPHIYRALDGEDLITAGRIDCVWPILEQGVLVVADWKTGKTMPPPAATNLQVNAAGIALCQRWKLTTYQPALYLARSGIWDVADEVEMGSAEWDRMLEEIKQAASLDDQPHPGPHCSDCWERKNCSEGGTPGA